MSSHPSYYPRANHHPASSSSGGNSNSGVQTSSSGRMALIASTIGGAGYAFNNGDDKDTGNGFEFTRRKRWPHLLLQELVGSALFCLKPIALQRDSIAENGSGPGWGWKIIFVSPSVGDMLGQKASDLENREFFDLVFTPDHPQLQTLFSALISPHAPLTHQPNSNSTITTSSSDDPNTSVMPSSTGRSHTAYVRMLPSDVEPGKDKGPVVWELRAHATGLDGGSANGAGSFGLAGSGTVVPRGSGDTGNAKGRAVWVMGRKIGEGIGEGEGNGQSLDAFLELKLENERLREELRELQLDMDEYEELQMRSNEPPPRLPQTYHPDLSSDDPDSSSASTSSASSSSPPLPYLTNVKPDISRPKPAKPGRPPKDPAAREKKRLKKASMGAAGGEREGLHVCVTCGRTDSPEWRKGPLGPKTLCNACGLRWAKRNSTQPTRKERKAAAEKKGQ